MEEQAPKGGWKLGTHSFHYMRIWFKDGNRRTMYSLDWKHKFSKSRDEQLGLKRLRKKIREYGSKANGAVIYSNLSRQPIENYYEGKPFYKNQ